MARVIITESLFKTIRKRFSISEANLVIDSLESLETNPHKGKTLCTVEGILIKEIKHKKYRFYCVTDRHTLKFGTEDELASLLIKFVRMSEKKDQQKAIDSVKSTLKSLGFGTW